ncbi:MAG: ABC transporter permease [Chloroflexi bacterium]|nr:ABC transporter permease [Chloroflexota bacterium]
MLGYILNRLFITVPVLVVVMVITFTLGYFAPGDPIILIYNEQIAYMTPEQVERLRHDHGLDKGYIEQATDYVIKVARGDLGNSIAQKLPVMTLIQTALPITMQLGLASAVILALVGIPLGLVAALRKNTWVDYIIVGGVLPLRVIPIFVLGPLLMFLFVLWIPILEVPIGWDGLLSSKIILPLILLVAWPLADIVRQMRSSALEVLTQDHVRTAHAKGLKFSAVILRHVMRNAMIPVVTSLGLIVNALLHGSVFVERLYTLGGFGQLVINAIQLKDFPVIMGTTLFGALLVVVANLVTDVIYPFLDPRVRL